MVSQFRKGASFRVMYRLQSDKFDNPGIRMPACSNTGAVRFPNAARQAIGGSGTLRQPPRDSARARCFASTGSTPATINRGDLVDYGSLAKNLWCDSSVEGVAPVAYAGAGELECVR